MNENALTEMRGPVVIACAAPYGVGGLGRHLQELVEFSNARGVQTRYFAFDVSNGPAGGTAIAPSWIQLLKRLPPVRFSPAWQAWIEARVFDNSVARQLPRCETLIVFNGQSEVSIAHARGAHVHSVLLASATPHINLVITQARKAFAYAPIESAGYIAQQHAQTLREYAAADRVLYATDYIRGSFLRENFPAEKLERFDLSAHPRFKAIPRTPDGVFRVVAIGSLNLIKGVAVLLEAYKSFNHSNSELVLVGGSWTRAMRRYLERRLAEDSRVRIAPGDPVRHLARADVCAHAAFQDGFAYAPMEALACGAPVIVSDHTGMKEFIRPGENGLIVPTGDAAALTNALRMVANGALRRTTSA
jgi:glycosyltransferase involved in cell wall biosynthesis